MHEKYTKVQECIFHMKSVVTIIREVLYSIFLRRAAEMLGDFWMLCLLYNSRSSSWSRSINSKLRDSFNDSLIPPIRKNGDILNKAITIKQLKLSIKCIEYRVAFSSASDKKHLNA